MLLNCCSAVLLAAVLLVLPVMQWLSRYRPANCGSYIYRIPSHTERFGVDAEYCLLHCSLTWHAWHNIAVTRLSSLYIALVQAQTCIVFLMDWVSDTRSQGYTDLQSLIECLGHSGTVSDTVCIQAKAVQCTKMHLGGYHNSHVLERLKSKAADRTIVAAVAGCWVEADTADSQPRA